MSIKRRNVSNTKWIATKSRYWWGRAGAPHATAYFQRASLCLSSPLHGGLAKGGRPAFRFGFAELLPLFQQHRANLDREYGRLASCQILYAAFDRKGLDLVKPYPRSPQPKQRDNRTGSAQARGFK